MSNFELDVSHFDLVSSDTMFTYETLIESRVRYLVSDIESRGFLVDPLLWDASLALLIDGQHRMVALRHLGVGHVPVYHVAYSGTRVSVRNWYRLIYSADLEGLASIVESTQARFGTSTREPPWNVVMRSCGGLARSFAVDTALQAAKVLQFSCERAQERGWEPKIVASIDQEDFEHDSACVLYVEPVIGKTQVLEILNSRHKFPPQVNRHLIDCRPIGMNLPTRLLTLPRAEARRGMFTHIIEKTQELIEAGSWHEGRFYEERTVRFQCSGERGWQ